MSRSIIGRTLVGIGAFGFFPALLSIIADLFPPHQRGRASMTMLIGQFSALSLVFGLGGLLLRYFGPGSQAWRPALLWLTLPGCVIAIVAALVLREPPRIGKGVATPRAIDALSQLWRFRLVVAPILVGKIFVLMALGSLMVWTAPALTRIFALEPHEVGAYMAILIPVSGIGGTIAGGFLADMCQRRGGPRRTILLVCCLLLACGPFCLFVLAPGALAASVFAGLAIGLLTCVSVMTATLLIVALPNEIRGLSMSALGGLTVLLSIGLSPLLVSWTSEALGGRDMLAVALATVCLAASGLAIGSFALGAPFLPRTQQN